MGGLKTCSLYEEGNFSLPISICGAGKSAYIRPFGDIHRDHDLFSHGAWEDFKESWMRHKNNTYGVGMGDYLDIGSASERETLAAIVAKMGTLHKNNDRKVINELDKYVNNWVDKLGREMMFMKGRLLGLTAGNHDFEFQDHTIVTQRLCRILECDFLGVCFLKRLKIITTTGEKFAFDVMGYHGKNATVNVGGSVQKVVDMTKSHFAQIYIMGHDHRKNAASDSLMRLNDDHRNPPKTVEMKRLYIRSGAFVKLYEPGIASLGVDRLLAPSNLGAPTISLTFHKKERKGERFRYIELNGSEGNPI